MDICKDIYIGKMTSLRDIWENPIFSVDFDSSLSPSVEYGSSIRGMNIALI